MEPGVTQELRSRAREHEAEGRRKRLAVTGVVVALAVVAFLVYLLMRS